MPAVGRALRPAALPLRRSALRADSPCAARLGVARRNSLRELRSLRSNKSPRVRGTKRATRADPEAALLGAAEVAPPGEALARPLACAALGAPSALRGAAVGPARCRLPLERACGQSRARRFHAFRTTRGLARTLWSTSRIFDDSNLAPIAKRAARAHRARAGREKSHAGSAITARRSHTLRNARRGLRARGRRPAQRP